jgi:hypothetical protein
MQITLSITLLFLHEIELKKKYEIMVINRTLKVPAYFFKEFNKKNTQSLKKSKPFTRMKSHLRLFLITLSFSFLKGERDFAFVSGRSLCTSTALNVLDRS